MHVPRWFAGAARPMSLSRRLDTILAVLFVDAHPLSFPLGIVVFPRDPCTLGLTQRSYPTRPAAVQTWSPMP